ncbi:MAG: hypothetical protein RIB86_16235, partial [Imperialibacter sp.]
ETLGKVHDSTGREAVITAISIVANPDFDKIRHSSFQEYFFESFVQTLNRYPGREGVFDLWKEGVSNRLFVPEFHAREHLHVPSWMRALRANDKDTHLAFDNEFWGFNNKSRHNVSYQAAFDVSEMSDVLEQAASIKSGLDLFEQLFGYRSSYIVPPNGPYNDALNEQCAVNGIRYIGTAKIRKEPLGSGQTRTRFHYLGERNRQGQRYITRNCLFEPSIEGRDWVSTCMSEMEIAFRWRKPAIVSTHRVNYIGALVEKNRTKGLEELGRLLEAIVQRWPNVEFLTTTELGRLLSNG